MIVIHFIKFIYIIQKIFKMSERYVCKLSPDLIKKAAEDLNEPHSDDEKHQAIDKLKTAFSEEKYGPLIRTDDLFFLRFLRAKKYNHDKALKCLQNYHKVRNRVGKILIVTIIIQVHVQNPPSQI